MASNGSTSSPFAQYVKNARPAMPPAATIQGDRWRIGILTESMIRLEWSDSGEFEDNPTQMVVNRDFQVEEAPQYAVTERDGLLVVDTPYLHLTYDRKPFSKEGLSIVVKGVSSSQFNTWHYGDEAKGNLKGTARTLDEADGAIPLGDGVIARDGWAVIDDSASNVIVVQDVVNGKKNPFGAWISPRGHKETDLYFFGYGHRYIEAVQDFYKLAGPTPLLPRYSLGNWWSRYYRYHQAEYLQLMDRFKKEGIPFSTAVIDMDWHRVDDVDPKYGSGWTGYSWNRELFPDHVRFLNDLHKKGLKTTLNVHPRDGVRAFEDAYPKAAERVGIDPASGDAVEFDLTDPDFVDAYFDMHHDMEDEGVDFWWIDWQQGGVTRQPGLDPLWALNHMHYLDSGRDGRWPLTFSRYAGPGSHRYPVGFSGDTVVTWRSLAFQPYFTATASNIGYGWWSHDIGGHMFGYRDEELEARWYQLGAFSPISRLHSTCSTFAGKEPWNFSPTTRESMVRSLRLRHMMLPYLYTMNYRAAEEGLPLVEPMYWQAADNDDAYDVPDEFRFGTEMIVSPIVSANDKAVQRGRTDVWLPQGEWFDFFNGRRYVSTPAAGRRLEAWRSLDTMPVFAKAGAIVPLQELADGEAVNDIANPRALRVLAFPGADGSFVMREDCGTLGADTADTEMSLVWRDAADATAFNIAAVRGDVAAVPERRDWTVVFRGVAAVSDAAVQATVDGQAVPCEVAYDEDTLSLSVTLHDVAVASAVRIAVPAGLTIAENPVVKDVMDLLLHAEMLYMTKEAALNAVRDLGIAAIGAFRTLERPESEHGMFCGSMPESVAGALAEILLRG